MSALPSARASKTICRPSGAQRGEPVVERLKAVNWTGCSPVPSHPQISQFPDRLEAKAILLPSGENCEATSALVEEISAFADCFRPTGVAPPDNSTCQMLLSAIPCDQARQLPWREMAKSLRPCPAASTRSGFPPAAGNLHKLPPTLFKNRMSRPSGVQVGDIRAPLSKVRRRASPPPSGAR